MSKDAPYTVEVQGSKIETVGFFTYRGFITFYRRLRGDTAHFTLLHQVGRTATFQQLLRPATTEARSEASTEVLAGRNFCGSGFPPPLIGGEIK